MWRRVLRTVSWREGRRVRQGFSCSGTCQGPQDVAPTERTGLGCEGGRGAEQVPPEGGLPAGCVPPPPGVKVARPTSMPCDVPSNIPGHRGAPSALEGAGTFALSAARGPGSGLCGPRHSGVDVAGKLRGGLGN